MERVKSKFTVSVIDVEGEAKKAFEALKAGYKEGTYFSAGMLFGLVKNSEGKTYLINSEGVGSNVSLDEQPDEILWYSERKGDEKTTYFSIVPVAKSTYTLDEMLAIPVIRELPLDEFIRTFGQRLDNNYHIWEKFLSKKAI